MNSSKQNYEKSGQILAKALCYAESLTKPGEKLLTIAENIEDFIRKHSAQPAFPVNISINEIAAHYSPTIEDKSTIPEKSIVKIDAGVSVDGYLTDAARTFIFDDKWKHMKQVAQLAFEEAVSDIQPNSSVYRVGTIVEQVVRKSGFKPIVNLSGHSLYQYSLHGGLSIPNYKVPKNARNELHIFEIGNAYAIEPFVTTGLGKVRDENYATIYRQYRSFKENSIPEGVKGIYNHINEYFHKLPFSWRWIYNAGFPMKEIEIARKQLINEQIIHGYPVLVEAKGAPVTQFEETIFVDKNEILIITRKREKEAK